MQDDKMNRNLTIDCQNIHDYYDDNSDCSVNVLETSVKDNDTDGHCVL